MLSRLSFRSAFVVFSINSLILPGFPLTFFHLVEANLVPRAIFKNYKTLFRLPLIAKICAGVNLELKPHYLSTFSWHYILVCAVVQKYHEMFFLKKFFLVLILQSTCFIFTTSKRKQTMEHQPHRVYE